MVIAKVYSDESQFLLFNRTAYSILLLNQDKSICSWVLKTLSVLL